MMLAFIILVLVMGIAYMLFGQAAVEYARDVAQRTMDYGRENKLAFYIMLAILPAIGAPVSPFVFAAPVLHGMVVAVIGTAIAYTVSLSLGYWLANSLARPAIAKLLGWMGHEAPTFSKKHYQTTLLVRFTPGLPYFIQNFILGIGGIPFWKYMLVSWPACFLIALAFMFMGETVAEGNIAFIMLALFLLLVVGVLSRKIYTKLKARQTKA